jgi:hypothetical protein
MGIEERHYKEFLGYFHYLDIAGSIISENIEPAKIVHNVKEIEQLIPLGPDLQARALTEIQSNLYVIPKGNHKSFLQNMLKGFSRIAPYFNFYQPKGYRRVYGKEVVVIDNLSFPESIKTVHKIIMFYVDGFGRYSWNVRVKEISDEYIILCFRRFVNFFNYLDSYCLSLGIDIMDIQREHNFHVWQREDKINSEKKVNIVSDQITNGKESHLSVKQIALIHIYTLKQITRENAGDIAAQYNYTSKNSGEGLFQDFNFFSSRANRIGEPTNCTKKKFCNKIQLFKSILEHLPEKEKGRLVDEIQILETKYNSEYL